MAEDNEKVILQGQEAIDLWQKGKDAWNKWVKENPVADVVFSGVDFSSYQARAVFENSEWPFAQFVFPTGDISFEDSMFDKGSVSFSGASFGDGNVSFAGVVFGDSHINFSNVQFGKGDVSFNFTSFGKRTVNFAGVSFGEGIVEFMSVNFGGLAIFSNLRNVSVIKNFSFRFSIFHSSLIIWSEEPFGCVVDLTSTKMSSQVSLERLQCKLRKTRSFGLAMRVDRFMRKGLQRETYRLLIRCVLSGEWLCKVKARDEKDIERFRRLKEIAGNNKSHDQALNFNVMEMQAKRWHNTTRAGLVFEFLFQKSSDYGRSEFYPLMWMLFFLSVWSGIYYWLSDCMNNDPIKKILTAVTFSVGQMIPFVPISRAARSDGAELLFPGDQLPNAVIWLASFQSLISIILIFLIGLSLRNRFRV